MCLLCTKEDVVICQKFISQSFSLLKKIIFFVKEKDNIINFVARTNMKKTKQRKQKIIKGEKSFLFPTFSLTCTDNFPTNFLANSPSGCKRICVSYFTDRVLASPHHSKH